MKAYHYGLEQKAALAAVTSEPAKAAGLFDRIGSLEVGKNADLVIWNDHFFRNGARPTHVFIEGNLEYKMDLKQSNENKIERNQGKLNIVEGSKTTFAIKDVKILTGTKEIIKGNIIVVNERISCVGECPIPEGSTEYSVSGSNGFVTPGLIESASALGLIEISGESATQDGKLKKRIHSQVSWLDQKYFQFKQWMELFQRVK
jgi:imidazolonepropionase-like amidohydrolase